MDKAAKLQQVIDAIRRHVANGELPIVIFDLDDTLFATAARDLQIMREFAADHCDEYPDFAATVAPLTLADMRWDNTEALVRAGLSPDSPALAPYRDYWQKTFFSDAYVTLDLPLPGAVAYVRECHAAGALIFYLTGRAVSDRGLSVGMEQGTARALTTRGFPFWIGRCELTLKVDERQTDDEFKADTLGAIASLRGRVVATFDNEPANANMFLANFPDALNFWLRTAWDPADNDPSPDLIAITDFLRG